MRPLTLPLRPSCQHPPLQSGTIRRSFAFHRRARCRGGRKLPVRVRSPGFPQMPKRLPFANEWNVLRRSDHYSGEVLTASASRMPRHARWLPAQSPFWSTPVCHSAAASRRPETPRSFGRLPRLAAWHATLWICSLTGMQRCVWSHNHATQPCSQRVDVTAEPVGKKWESAWNEPAASLSSVPPPTPPHRASHAGVVVRHPSAPCGGGHA